jgi:recombination protein RecR
MEKFNNLVESLAQLPTVGKKSAIRFAYHMVIKDSFGALKLANAIENAITHIAKCSRCGNLSEDELCAICSDEMRDSTMLCIVESVKDIYTIEENGDYEGVYFVLEDIEQETIERLLKVVEIDVCEVIFAFSPTLANDSLALFVEDKLQNYDLSFSKIAQGVPTGVGLENVDRLSLTNALKNRTTI